MAETLPPRPADEDWQAITPAQAELVKGYVEARYGSVAAQDYADWYARQRPASQSEVSPGLL